MEKNIEYCKDGFSSKDYKVAIEQWKLRLVGSPELNDMCDADIAAKVKAVEDNCRKYYESMHREDGLLKLWGEGLPIESVELERQFRGIFALALGYGTYGNEFYHKEEILCDILFGLEWMYEHMYGEAEKRNEGWRDIYACNWWYWFIGAPELFTDIYIIIEEHLSRNDIRRYTSLYEWLRQDPKSGIKSTTVNIEAKLGILLEDAEKLRWCNQNIHDSMEITEYGKVRKDFTHWWHDFPHNMTYGVGQNLSRPLFVSSIFASTALKFSSPRKYNQFLMLKYMFEPAMYHGRGFFMLSGRQTAGKEYEKGARTLALSIPMIGVYGEEEDLYIKRFIKTHSKDPVILQEVKKQATIFDLAMLNSILYDDNVPDSFDYEYAHAWYTGDRAVQHRSGYAIGISMSSLREVSYESILGLNTLGWYTADGATYLYTDYDKNAYDGDNFITKNKDIAHRIPGTTEDEQQKVPRSIKNNYAWRNPSRFAGSIQVDDKYLVCAMDFVGMHYDGADDIVDDGYGGGLVPHKNDLVAKKSWFCFDKETICLGAGITSTMNSPVNTVIEHKRIVDDEKYTQYLNGDALPKDSFSFEGEMDSFVMDGHAGFLLLDGNRTLVRRYKGESGQSFIEYLIRHGENPTNASYAYVILPFSTVSELEKYREKPEVEIISNTKEVQAVCKESLKITAYAFHEAAECHGIKVSAPCILTRKSVDAEVVICVSDPTHKLEEMTVTVIGAYQECGAGSRAEVRYENEGAVITFDMKASYGEPRTFTLRKKMINF